MEQKFYSEGARLPVEGDGGEKCPVISRERLESFLSFLQSKGRAKETIRVYRRCLERLLTFLPDNKGQEAAPLIFLYCSLEFSPPFQYSPLCALSAYPVEPMRGENACG